VVDGNLRCRALAMAITAFQLDNNFNCGIYLDSCTELEVSAV
jgi:hypothetical protein